MNAATVTRSRGLLAAGAAVALAAVSTVAVAAASDAFGHHSNSTRAGTGCAVPSLPGAVVRVNLADMRAMMGRAGGGPMMGPGDWRQFRHGMMRVTASPATVAHGVVSLRVANIGYPKHELVVLPLTGGQLPGARVPGADGKVDETGSLGEASATCTAGSGDGIAAGSTGWVTLTLTAGRYELLCNLPGHYSGGMYTELDVT
jgi:uncharacterized cupredoxin-like copper-binding protein